MAYIKQKLLDKAELSKRLFELREKFDYSKQTVADGIGMHVSNYSKCEEGISEMSLHNRDRAAAFFDVPLDYFIYAEYSLEMENDRVLNAEFVKKLSKGQRSMALDIESAILKNLE